MFQLRGFHRALQQSNFIVECMNPLQCGCSNMFCHIFILQAMKPSNHATMQSIVRAVGVVPSIPEPCCVPDKISSLSILFFDENKNVVLKVYPNMTVESCACR